MIDLWVDLAVAALMLAAIYGVGRAIWQLVKLPMWCRTADLAYALALGLGAILTLLFGLALVGWLRPLAGWSLIVIGVILAALQYRQLLTDLTAAWGVARRMLTTSWFVKVAMLITAAFVLTNLVGNLAPPVEGDTVHQYLLVPRYWVTEGRYVQPSHIWASTLPGHMMMLSAWALLLRGSYSLATLVTGLSMSLLLALAVFALTRLYFGRGVAALAAMAIYTMPDAGYLAQSAKVDMGWAFFETLALAAFFRWLDQSGASRDGKLAKPHPERWLILAGVCLGLAAASKNQTAISVALLGLWLVLRQALRGEWRSMLRAVLAFGLATLIVALPYYLYNGIVHHNPFYPVFADLFTRLLAATPSPRSELGTEIFYPWTVGGYLANLWNSSLGHTRPGFYLGFIAGPVFLLTIPIGVGLGLLRGEYPAWRMLAYALAFSVVWFLVKQAVRHFLPGLVLMASVAGLVLWRLTQRQTWPRRIVLGVTVLSLGWNLVSQLGVLYWNGAYRVALGLESRDEYLLRWHNEVIIPIFPDWETIRALNELPPSTRVLAEHATSPLYIELDLVSGNWGDRENLDGIADPKVLIDKLEAQHIDYILVYNADPDETRLFTRPDFLAAYGTLVYEGERARLYRIAEPER